MKRVDKGLTSTEDPKDDFEEFWDNVLVKSKFLLWQIMFECDNSSKHESEVNEF